MVYGGGGGGDCWRVCLRCALSVSVGLLGLLGVVVYPYTSEKFCHSERAAVCFRISS